MPGLSESGVGQDPVSLLDVSVQDGVLMSIRRSDLENYLRTPSRYALGERKVVIHTPRVGQRSYGTEKR
jgi:hypothetical protein